MKCKNIIKKNDFCYRMVPKCPRATNFFYSKILDAKVSTINCGILVNFLSLYKTELYNKVKIQIFTTMDKV